MKEQQGVGRGFFWSIRLVSGNFEKLAGEFQAGRAVKMIHL